MSNSKIENFMAMEEMETFRQFACFVLPYDNEVYGSFFDAAFNVISKDLTEEQLAELDVVMSRLIDGGFTESELEKIWRAMRPVWVFSGEDAHRWFFKECRDRVQKAIATAQ